MDNIERKLAQLDLGVDDLPQEIKKLIDAIDYQTQKLEQQIEDYENSGEKNDALEFKFNENYSVLESKEKYVIDKIQEYKEAQDKKLQAQAEAEAEAKAKADAEAEAKAKADAEAQAKPKKKGLGIGSIILGVAVLAVTMGAVNTMRNK